MEYGLSKVQKLNADQEQPFLSLIFNFLVCVYVCVCVCVCACLFILFMSPFLLLLTYYLSLSSLLFILFWYCFYSFCWKHKDSNYRKYRKREFSNNKDKTKIKQNYSDYRHYSQYYWMNEWINVWEYIS